MPHTHVEVSQTGFQGVPLEDHDHLHVHRLYDERPTDKSHYLMTWLIELHAGEPVLGHFFSPTVVYVIEGEFHLDDESKPGHITKLVAGDVTHVDENSNITWSSPNKGKGFGACWAPTDRHPEDIAVKK